MRFTVFTDGASRGNPGPAAYGFRITNELGRLIYEEGKYIGKATNNEAEYAAVLAALKWIRKHIKPRVYVEVFADSKLVAEQLSGRFKVKSVHLKPIIEKIKMLSIELGGVLFTHVPREENTLADKLANKALDSRSSN